MEERRFGAKPQLNYVAADVGKTNREDGDAATLESFNMIVNECGMGYLRLLRQGIGWPRSEGADAAVITSNQVFKTSGFPFLRRRSF